MTYLTSAVVAGGLLAAVAAASMRPVSGDGTANAAAAPRPDAVSYRVTANGGEAACSVTRGGTVDGGLATLTVGAGCEAVLPGMERARYWKEQADGSVAFSENGIDAIVRFGVADGVDYESFQPASPLIALASAD